MKANTSTSQKIGAAIFAIGAIYMFGLGWLYSWRVVPAANIPWHIFGPFILISLGVVVLVQGVLTKQS